MDNTLQSYRFHGNIDGINYPGFTGNGWRERAYPPTRDTLGNCTSDDTEIPDVGPLVSGTSPSQISR